jgi:hypothetical protein
MQTFLPFADFAASARVLDDRRLGKQRVEGFQIVRALTWPTYGWKNHPAVRMWRGHLEALGSYVAAVCEEWVRRGYADTVAEKVTAELAAAGVRKPPRAQAQLAAAGLLPAWLGDERVHRSHRAALLRKDPVWYVAHFAEEDIADLPYHWPVGPDTGVDAARSTA